MFTDAVIARLEGTTPSQSQGCASIDKCNNEGYAKTNSGKWCF